MLTSSFSFSFFFLFFEKTLIFYVPVFFFCLLKFIPFLFQVGTKGRIRLCQPFHCTTQLIIKKTGEKERVEEFTLPDAVSTLKSGSDGGPDLAYNFVNRFLSIFLMSFFSGGGNLILCVNS